MQKIRLILFQLFHHVRSYHVPSLWRSGGFPQIGDVAHVVSVFMGPQRSAGTGRRSSAGLTLANVKPTLEQRPVLVTPWACA